MKREDYEAAADNLKSSAFCEEPANFTLCHEEGFFLLHRFNLEARGGCIPNSGLAVCRRGADRAKACFNAALRRGNEISQKKKAIFCDNNWRLLRLHKVKKIPIYPPLQSISEGTPPIQFIPSDKTQKPLHSHKMKKLPVYHMRKKNRKPLHWHKVKKLPIYHLQCEQEAPFTRTK